jgi:outer membrane protein assembly factor BamE
MMRAIIAQAIPMQAIFRTRVLLIVLTAALAGCFYRMNIQQGNFLEAKTIDQVQKGMTRSQVRYLLGTPMVPDAFDNSRWDYVYYLRKGRLKAPQQRHLIVRFADEKVSDIDRASMPSNSTLPLPDAERPPPSREDIPPSDPRAVQPDNPGSTQPGSPQPQSTPLPKEPPPSESKQPETMEPAVPAPTPAPQPDPGG